MKTALLRSLVLASLVVTAVGAAGCDGSDETGSESSDQVEGLAEGSAAALATIAMVNDPSVTADWLRQGKIEKRAAQNIVARRLGADGQPRTSDDVLFTSIADVDAVTQVGVAALKKLRDLAKDRGYLAAQEKKVRQVIFSPQAADKSHNAAVAEAIGKAERTLDIAMYSYSDAKIGAALDAAVKRGVKVRFLFDTAADDKKLTGSALTGSKSGRLEAMGVDVRWVNKINHHKFVIIDGPREDAAFAADATLITGSGNWSSGAATVYDENTLFFTAYPELNLRFQREFDHLWEHSRDLASNPAITSDTTIVPIADEDIVEDPGMHVWFTSDNFNVNGDTFTGNRKNTISDRLVAAIGAAEDRIHVMSGHLRSRPVTEALIAKKADMPDLDIRVYLDGQEYISQSADDEQQASLETCLATANTDSKRANCLDKGFLFGKAVGEADIDVRYKYYAYRWNASYAAQMHNKTLIIDDALFTGSYNLSDNAEHATFENILELDGPEFADLVEVYDEHFEALWVTGEGKLEGFRSQVDTQTTFPIVFPAMSLSWAEVRDLKSLISQECPAVNSAAYRTAPTSHQSCTK
jgi:phosphatidylserine/phosphatidylglycerophosphate/cardiolipin synthase-like enzyme